MRSPDSPLADAASEHAMDLSRHLLWVDCAAAAAAGLALSGPLARLEGLPRGVLRFTGAVNLLYAFSSFALARRRRRPAALVGTLAAANVAWAPVCLGLAAAFKRSATPWGMAHLVGEAAFVGGLGALEWRHRRRLAAP